MVEAITPLLEASLSQVAIDLALAALERHALKLRRDPAVIGGYDDTGWIGNLGILSHTLWQLATVNGRADRFTNQEVTERGLLQVQVEHDGVARSKPRVIVRWILRAKHRIAVGAPTDT